MRKLVIVSTVISNVISILAGLCLDIFMCICNDSSSWVTGYQKVIPLSGHLLALGAGYLVSMLLCAIIFCPFIFMVAVCKKDY